MQFWKTTVSIIMVTTLGAVQMVAESRAMQPLTFVEVLEVVSIGVQMEKQSLIRREPSLETVFRDAEKSLGTVIQGRTIQPDEVFGKMQNDLGHHDDRLFAVFFQDFWDVMELYRTFYAINAELRGAGVRTPFEAFLQAIHRGLRDEAVSPVFIAGDSGSVNPINLLEERELIFVSW